MSFSLFERLNHFCFGGIKYGKNSINDNNFKMWWNSKNWEKLPKVTKRIKTLE